MNDDTGQEQRYESHANARFEVRQTHDYDTDHLGSLPRNDYQIILADPPWPYYGDPNKMADLIEQGEHER